jgi:membrane fusion protein, copper/silver efflux system
MKYLIIIITGLTLWACSSADHTKHQTISSDIEVTNVGSMMDSSFQSSLQRIIHTYNNLKDLLVESNFTAAQQEAKSLQTEIQQITLDSLPNTDKVSIQKDLEDLSKSSQQLMSCLSLKDQRISFEQLSSDMIKLCEKGVCFNDTVYIQHCPMAFDDHGADWISLSPIIMNPYWGDKMLHCGEVKRALVQ